MDITVPNEVREASLRAGTPASPTQGRAGTAQYAVRGQRDLVLPFILARLDATHELARETHEPWRILRQGHKLGADPHFERLAEDGIGRRIRKPQAQRGVDDQHPGRKPGEDHREPFALMMIDIDGLRRIWTVNRIEFIFALIALWGPIGLGVLNGVIVGSIPSSHAAARYTCCASKMASPDFGITDENHMKPSPGSGLSLDRAPTKKIDRSGTPSAALCGSTSRWA